MNEVKVVRESFLDIQSPHIISDSIEFIEYRDISAQKEQLNSESRSICLNIDYFDDYILLDKSYFVMDVELLKTDGQRYANTAEIALTNNGLMYLFNHAEYEIENAKIESFNDPGITTLISGLLKYDTNTSESVGQDFGWILDGHDYSALSTANTGFRDRKNQILKRTSKIGNYRFLIPFTHIFGSCSKILRGAKVKITFLRSSSLDKNAIYKSSAQTSGTDNVDDGKVMINDLVLMVACPKLNESVQAQISEYLRSKPTIPLQFTVKHLESKAVNTSSTFNWNLSFSSRDQKLYGIAVVFQTNRLNNQKANAAVFDNLKAEHAEVQLNGIIYPGNILNALDTESFSDLYLRYKEFRKLFTSGYPEVDSGEYKTAFPMYCFNLMHQKTKTLSDPYNGGLRFKFKTNVAADTTCYALFFFEKYLTFTTFGDNKMVPMVM